MLGLMLLLLLVLYRDTTLYLAGIWSNWEDGGYSHGYLVVLISCYIIYSERRMLVRMAPCPYVPALLAVAACGLIWSVAGVATVQGMQAAVLLPLVTSVVWVVLGTQVTLKLLLPLMFVGLAIPVWSPLLPPLQVITAESAFWLTRLYGIPAFMQDFTLHLPAGRLSIHEACSGLHYLLAGVTLGVFYAWLNYRRWWSGLLGVLTIAVGAILANVLRVFIIIVLAYNTDMQHPYVEDHLRLGWYLFGALVFLLLLADQLFGRRAGKACAEHVAIPATSCKYATASRLVIFSITAALLTAGPVMA
ncbi:MAG TPA: exosortase A, partial [Gammaproteobacteria bacterium]|nr:exosortase A [Gammaproteobacteria bacterium]